MSATAPSATTAISQPTSRNSSKLSTCRGSRATIRLISPATTNSRLTAAATTIAATSFPAAATV
uniref:hypothetical protein n=1 Tax=Fodinicola feengrottensis TaxID=435914 RepID=UPI002441D7FD|nr:hypothetical protein [Fodinicola feengrottensis]